LEIDPQLAVAHSNLGVYFKDQGKLDEAAAHFEASLAIEPSNTLRVLLATLLPPVYASQENVAAWRRRVIENLDRLREQGVNLDPGREVVPNFFYLAYQGCNDRDIQRDLAALYAAHASLSPPLAARAAGERIRVGFISKYFKDHTIGVLMRGVIAKLARDRVEVTVLTFEEPRDPVGEFLQKHADRHVVLPSHLPAVRQLVTDLGLDVLFYADIGMDPLTYSLAFTRLAPVQCVTWGHPLTTGIPTIDYFISSALIEPDGAEEHYTEKLVRLRTLPFYYYRPSPPARLQERTHFDLPADAHVYACLQTLFKFHPDFDAALGGILRRDPKALVIAIQGKHRYWEELLRRRWSRTLSDVVERIRFVPPQKRDDFFNLMMVSDVLLDTFPFSGGNTSYEGLALGVPIVTLAAPYMRGRITYALYRKMGVMDCVAHNVAEYVDLAVRLGSDMTYRESVRERINATSDRLFEDIEAVRELEAFFAEAVEKTREAGNRADQAQRR
jgi:predicted O-linked N-acetylglucosamine transferase (SPINDLY family)